MNAAWMTIVSKIATNLIEDLYVKYKKYKEDKDDPATNLSNDGDVVHNDEVSFSDLASTSKRDKTK